MLRKCKFHAINQGPLFVWENILKGGPFLKRASTFPKKLGEKLSFHFLEILKI